MASDNLPQRSEEVDGLPAAQHRRTDDRVFTGRGRQLRTGGISMGSIHPHFALPAALAGPLAPRVDQAEERALVRVAAADVEGRVNILLHQLDDTDHCGVGGFFFFSVFPLLVYSSGLLSNRE
jgi:hypothetical protein